MFKPVYRITEYFLECIENIAALQAQIAQTRLRLPALLRLQEEAFQRNVHSSTLIEGNELSLRQVADLSRRRDVRADERQKREVKNYIQALRWTLRQAKKPLRERDLLHLHGLITRGLVEAGRSGKYRRVQNYVVDGQKRVVYRPPAPAAVPRLMRDLFAWLGREQRINAVAASAIFHHQFVAIHPFADGNGRVARAAGLWVLYQKQYDPLHILALDDYFAEDRKQYYLKIRQVRELDGDLTYWLDYVAKGVAASMEKALTHIRQLAISPKQDVVLSLKQEELLRFLKQNAGCGSKEIGAALKINRARVNQLIAPLVKAGIVRVEGKARTTKYTL